MSQILGSLRGLFSEGGAALRYIGRKRKALIYIERLEGTLRSVLKTTHYQRERLRVNFGLLCSLSAREDPGKQQIQIQIS